MKNFKYILVILGLLLVANLTWPGGIFPSCDREEDTSIQAFAQRPPMETIPEHTAQEATIDNVSDELPYAYTWRVEGYFVRKDRIEISGAPRGYYNDIFYVNQKITLIGLSSNEEERILKNLSLPDTTAVPVNRVKISFLNRYKLKKTPLRPS